MNDILISARHFFVGIINRYYWWIFAFLLNPMDVYQTLIRELLPERLRFDIPVGGTVFVYVLVAGVFISAVLSYHELRVRHDELASRSKAARATDRALRQLSRLRSFGIHKLWAVPIRYPQFQESWIPLHDRWIQVVGRHLQEHFDPVSADRFRVLGELDGRKYSDNAQVNQRKNMLSKELRILEELLGSDRIEHK